MSRHFIYLTNSRVVSIATRGKRIATRREFAGGAAGLEEFTHHVASLARSPTHVFTDLAEEDFRVDTVPHVRAGDREAIFARRLAQIYRNSPFRHAVVQGREAEGRRDDRVLYTAVTNPEVLRPWLDVLERFRVPLQGIHSTALVSGALLQQMALVPPHALLVTLTPGEAVRQTYFRASEFRFSRLTPVDLGEGQTLGALIAEETARTWQYLDSLRNFGPDDVLEVCVVLHSRDRAEAEPLLRSVPQLKYRILDIEQVAAKLGLQPPPLGSTAEELLVHVFLMRPVGNHFASPELRRYSTLRSARMVLNQVSAAVLVTGLAWGGVNLARILQGNAADERVGQQLQAYNREYDEITRNLPSFGVGGSAMRDAVTFYNTSIKSFPAVNDFIVPLSTVLAAHPHVRLAQIGWLVTDDPKVTPILAPSTMRAPPPVKSLAKVGAGLTPPPPDDGTTPFTTGRYEIAVLEASLEVPSNDFRGALERVQALAAAISRIPGYRAEVAESPIDLRPTLALQGRLANDEGGMMEPRFMVRVVRDRKPAA